MLFTTGATISIHQLKKKAKDLAVSIEERMVDETHLELPGSLPGIPLPGSF